MPVVFYHSVIHGLGFLFVSCRLSNVIPETTNMYERHVKTRRIMQNAEKKVVKYRIRQRDFPIRNVEENIHLLKLSLHSKLSIDMSDQIFALFVNTHSLFFEKSRNRQGQKFYHLQSKEENQLSVTNVADTSIFKRCRKWVFKPLPNWKWKIHSLERFELQRYSLNNSRSDIAATEHVCSQLKNKS